MATENERRWKVAGEFRKWVLSHGMKLDDDADAIGIAVDVSALEKLLEYSANISEVLAYRGQRIAELKAEVVEARLTIDAMAIEGRRRGRENKKLKAGVEGSTLREIYVREFGFEDSPLPPGAPEWFVWSGESVVALNLSGVEWVWFTKEGQLHDGSRERHLTLYRWKKARPSPYPDGILTLCGSCQTTIGHAGSKVVGGVAYHEGCDP